MAAPDLFVGPENEAYHTPSGDPLWSESFYLNFSDARGVLGGFTRLATHPGRNLSEGVLCLYLPGGGVAIGLMTGPLEQPDANTVRCGGLLMECLEPLRRWRFSYDGELTVFADPAQIPGAAASGVPAPTVHVQIAFEYSGLHVPVFYPHYTKVSAPPMHATGAVGLMRKLRRAARLPREIVLAIRMRTGRHYEQSMRITGTIAIDGHAFEIDGGGHRDHSWGLRDWSILQHLRWLSGQMDGFAFNAVYLTIAGSSVTNGYVWRDGRCSAVDEVQLENTFDATGIAAQTVRLTLRCAEERFVITGDVLMNVPLPIPATNGVSTMYTVGRTRYAYGDRTGYGVAEFLERIDP